MTLQNIFFNLASKRRGTFRSMQYLVMSMADYVNGKNKEEKMLENLAKTLAYMDKENVISLRSTNNEIVDAFFRELNIFQIAFPNWKDAYSYTKTQEFGESLNSSIQYLRIYGTSKFLENKMSPLKLTVIAVFAILVIYYLFQYYETTQSPERKLAECLEIASKRPTDTGVKLAAQACYSMHR